MLFEPCLNSICGLAEFVVRSLGAELPQFVVLGYQGCLGVWYKVNQNQIKF